MAEIKEDKGMFIVDLSTEKLKKTDKETTDLSKKIKKEFETMEEAKAYMKKLHFQGAYMKITKARTQSK